MHDVEGGEQQAFASFRVLNGDGNTMERDYLFRNLGQLFSFVSDRCDDDQVAQYDKVLCQLADLVEAEARAHVARLLAPLERAPGMVVVKLANDEIAVAKPLLEFSNVLSDDDLIDIVSSRSEEHRLAIAGRPTLTERVGDAIVEQGGKPSVVRLVQNEGAEIGLAALQKLVSMASEDTAIARDLRLRKDVDWGALSGEIAKIAGNLIKNFAPTADQEAMIGRLNALVYNRLRNRAGFNSEEWKLAYNQVKALADRRQLDQRALARFVRFGYGHHTAAALTQLMHLTPEVFVKWLATQDYVAMTVAVRAHDIDADLFEAMVAVMPWRDVPSEIDKINVRLRFEALKVEEASDIFNLWRSHAFRRREPGTTMAATA